MRALILLLVLLAFSFRSHAAEEGETTYQNPVDGKGYTAKWKTYTAEPEGTPTPEGKVSMGTIRLLADQTLIEQNLTAEAIAGFIVAVRDRISSAVPGTARKFELFVQVTLTATAPPKFEMSYKGGPPKKLLQAIYDSLSKAPNLRSKKDAVPFQINFVIRDKP
jgi:hypothetical protein